MKKILFFIATIMLSIVSYGQLLVDSLGNMGLKAGDSIVKSTFAINSVGQSDYDVYVMSNKLNGMYIKNTKNNYGGNSYGLHVYNTSNHRGTPTTTYGVYAEVGNPVGGVKAGTAYGLFGQAGKGNYTYGTFGNLLTANCGSGAGVCGAVDCATPNIAGQYAGYFHGPLYVYGTLYTLNGTYMSVPEEEDVESTVSLSVKNDLSTTSFGNINNNTSILNKLTQIEAVKYNLNTISLSSDSLSSTVQTQTLSNEESTIKYGLDATTLSEQFPSLVKTNPEGGLSIDYTSLIPILLQSIKELQAEVAVLKNNTGNNVSIAYSSSKPIGTTGVTSENIDATIVASIAQNTPNPFSEETRISYTIPESVSEAMICIYDMNGTQIERIDITERGSSSVVIEAYKLNAGMYLYSLIADGNIIDTKRMVLTK